MNCLLLFFFPISGEIFSSVFLRQVSVDKLSLSWHFRTSVPPYSNWRDEAFWTREGGYGFWILGPRAKEAGVLVRFWIGVFSFLVIRLVGDEDERKSKAQNGFFICK